MARKKQAMGFSATEETKVLLKKAAREHFEGNISMVINFAIKEWMTKNGYIRKGNTKAGH